MTSGFDARIISAVVVIIVLALVIALLSELLSTQYVPRPGEPLFEQFQSLKASTQALVLLVPSGLGIIIAALYGLRGGR